MRTTIRVILAALLVALPLCADDGANDATFSGDGRHVYSFGSNSSYARALLALPDGALLVGGPAFAADSTDDFGVVRLLADGSVDLAFGALGQRRVDFDDADPHDDQLLALGRSSSGALTLIGVSERTSEVWGDTQRPSMARLTAGGDLDPTFDGDGLSVVETTGWADPSLYIEAAAVAPDGKLVWVGYCYACGGDARLLVVRRLASGAPDPGFDGDGWVAIIAPGSSSSYGSQLTFDAAGRILVVGRTDDGNALFRLTDAGALDPSFGGGDGVAELPAAYSAYEWANRALAVDGATGDLLVAVVRSNVAPVTSAVVRLSSTGAVVQGFGDQGVVELTVDGGSRISALAVQGDGRIVGAGSIQTTVGNNQDFFLCRLEADGDLDPTFDDNGLRRIAIDVVANGQDFGYALALSAGRPVVAGSAQHPTAGGAMAIARVTNGYLFADGFERGSTGGWHP